MLSNYSFVAADEGYSDDEGFKQGPPSASDRGFRERMRRRHSTTRSPSHAEPSVLGPRYTHHAAAGGQVTLNRERNPFKEQPPAPRRPQTARPMDNFFNVQTALPPYQSPPPQPNPFEPQIHQQMPSPYTQQTFPHAHNNFHYPPHPPPPQPQPGYAPVWDPGYYNDEQARRPLNRESRQLNNDPYEEEAEEERRRQLREKQQQQKRAKAKAKEAQESHRREVALKQSITREVKEMLDRFGQQHTRQSSDVGARGLIDLLTSLTLSREGSSTDRTYASPYQRSVGDLELEHRLASVERYMQGHNLLPPPFQYHGLPAPRGLLDPAYPPPNYADAIRNILIGQDRLARSLEQMQHDRRSLDGSLYHTGEPLAIRGPPSTTSSQRRRPPTEPELASQASASTRRSRSKSVYGEKRRESVDYLKVPEKRLDRLDKEYQDLDVSDDGYDDPAGNHPTEPQQQRLRGTRRAPARPVERSAPHFEAPRAASKHFAQRTRRRTPYIEDDYDSEDQYFEEDDDYQQQPKAPRRQRRATDNEPVIIKIRSQPTIAVRKGKRQSVHGTVQIEAGSEDDLEDDDHGNYIVSPKPTTRQTQYAFDRKALERRLSRHHSRDVPRMPQAPSVPPS